MLGLSFLTQRLRGLVSVSAGLEPNGFNLPGKPAARRADQQLQCREFYGELSVGHIAVVKCTMYMRVRVYEGNRSAVRCAGLAEGRSLLSVLEACTFLETPAECSGYE